MKGILHLLIYVFFFQYYKVTSQDCKPVGDCINEKGGSFSISFYPDFTSLNYFAYWQFISAVCSNLQYYYMCQIENRTAMVTSCEYIVGEFEGSIASTQSQRQQLAEKQCLDITGVAKSVECRLQNSNIQTSISTCTTAMESQESSSICSAVTAYYSCINPAVQTCTADAINFWNVSTQEYIDIFCTSTGSQESSTVRPTINSAMALTAIIFLFWILGFNIYSKFE